MRSDDAIGEMELEYRAFLLDFRKRTGRPMTGLEESLAHMAFASGYTAGVDWAYGDVMANMPSWAEAR